MRDTILGRVSLETGTVFPDETGLSDADLTSIDRVTLIACGFLVVSLKAPVLGALLLVVMKLVYDLVTLKNGPRQRGEEAAPMRASRLLVAGRRKPG